MQSIKKTTTSENSLIWFGAGLSVAEIITGTAYAGMGMASAFGAILLGHVIGCLLLGAAGWIGAKTARSSMQTVRMSFGHHGAKLFALLNVLQLAGWTSIMTYDAAVAANGVWGIGQWVWCAVIGALIIVWILIGVTNLGKVNVVAMAALFVLTVIISVKVFSAHGSLPAPMGEAMSFGMGVELAVAMPLSWLPLISDYTRTAAKPAQATIASAVTYGLVSCWMYAIGYGMATFAGTADLAQMLLTAGLGVAGLIVIVFSTVTTTFLDAWSSGISAEALHERIPSKWVAIGVTVLGAAAAMLFNMDSIVDFLYLIGSVFAPMIAILIVDFFVFKRDVTARAVDPIAIVTWIAGLALYRVLMLTDLPLGYTIVDFLATGALLAMLRLLARRFPQLA